jgi:ferredoxin
MEGNVAEKKGALRLSVDSTKCQGHNRCCALAPELFEADELGFALVKDEGHVSETLEAKALLAVRNCPEYAVRAERK